MFYCIRSSININVLSESYAPLRAPSCMVASTEDGREYSLSCCSTDCKDCSTHFEVKLRCSPNNPSG